ncbi:putative membrane protein [Candidatus Ichthyocystis hellenicum]|uniref:Putative membrane protein n=1 Tax=Candidatus Ichthyocystis hellenicum TaxID=1561003 RepID=A0A0S4M3L4_9BURK|nr:putative membrane protein [Candidatus Ichthyocystis hellenicum]
MKVMFIAPVTLLVNFVNKKIINTEVPERCYPNLHFYVDNIISSSTMLSDVINATIPLTTIVTKKAVSDYPGKNVLLLCCRYFYFLFFFCNVFCFIQALHL